MISSTVLRNPKSYAFSREGRTLWYEYYACYSPEFVEDILYKLNLSSDAVILDPWNGSGTTTFVAERAGFRAIGLDINPVMIIVAIARAISVKSSNILLKHSAKILFSRLHQDASDMVQEPLLNWLKPKTARSFRQIEMAIRETSSISRKQLQKGNLKSLKPITAFLYLALFRVFRKLVSRYSSSNPTWFKEASNSSERISLSESAICAAFISEVHEMIALDDFPRTRSGNTGLSSSVFLASSRNLPLEDNCVDAIIASPPYCTRIDYAMATRPELAILGLDDDEFRSLRESMIGSPTISSALIEKDSLWGSECNSFLNKVKSHSAKASATYYYRNHLQYFESMYASFEEINRVLKPGGQCVLVAQDSYYKEIRNNLPRIFKEMARSFKWDVQLSKSFSTKKTFAQINSEFRKYSSVAKRQEQIIIFKKRFK